MRTLLLSVTFLFALTPPAPSQTSSSSRTPVLVELFTSEGCSSCPPADKLLATLQTSQPVPGANIIVVEEHVDYWDHLGWHDRFSSAKFTERQNLYAPHLHFDDPYTPQMVVDGQSQFLGSDPFKAISSITQAAGSPKITLTLAKPSIEGLHLSSSVSTPAGGATLPKGDLYAILIEPSASTEVQKGENGGRHLNHVSIARSFQHIGNLQDLSRGPIFFKLNAPTDTDPAHLRLIVFAQSPNQGAVQGVTETMTMP
ncbi:MAG TPA: DUF1223 domain-containing protein [Edaphobacter sp.]|jgi:hypothetical protein|nr:DUF1223 domain-containing protein [Edaphobacter sp.]